MEFLLTGRVDNIEFQPSQDPDDGANLQDAEPYEGQQPPQALVVHGRVPCWVAGGDDPFGDDDDMDDDEDAPGGPGGPGRPRGQDGLFAADDGWIVTVCTRDGGESFFYSELKRLLDQQLEHGMFAVEYRSEHWSHPEYPTYWRVWAHVGRPNPTLRALRIMSIHEAVAERSTQMAGINDVARQAFYTYRDHFFEEIS